MKGIFPVVFGVMFVSVFVWFGLCHRLFKLLEARHPEKFSEMGRPSLIMNNSVSNNISFMKFLLKREYRELNAPLISNLGRAMRVFFVVFCVVFMFLFLGVPLGYAP
jgi:hypothetical protein